MLLTKLVASFVMKVLQEVEKLQHKQPPQTAVDKTSAGAVYSSPTNRERTSTDQD